MSLKYIKQLEIPMKVCVKSISIHKVVLLPVLMILIHDIGKGGDIADRGRRAKNGTGVQPDLPGGRRRRD